MNELQEIVLLHKQPNKTSSFLQKYFFNYISIPITYFIVNFTRLTPTQVTLIGFFCYLISLYFFLTLNFLWGFVFYWMSFVFDIVDGNVARLKKQATLSGAYLDIILDWFKPPFVYLAIYLYSKELIILVLIIINFLAAGSWRIYLNILCENSIEPTKSSRNNITFNDRFNIKKYLSMFSSIEVEFMVVGLYLVDFNTVILIVALLIRTKDMIKNILASYLKLKALDRLNG